MTRRRRRSRDGAATAALWLCGLGHAAALGSLAVIGPPPMVRVDAWWVNGHRSQVQVCLLGLAVSTAA
ncbi:MAG: hypothetical protein SYC29_13710, partial [Planctomycetota bacterium]|nr:hypothetical protein [Planctomycetota bacterium]